MNFPDYYAVLGLPRFYPTQEEIQDAFLRKLTELHDASPDVDPDARQELDSAFLTLSDAKKKRQYDEVLDLYVQAESVTPNLSLQEKKRPGDIFEYHYERACQLILSYPTVLLTQTASFELAFVMYSIAKIAAAGKGKDTESVCSDVWVWIASVCFPNADYEALRTLWITRTSFYDGILLGGNIIGYCLLMWSRDEIIKACERNIFFRFATAYTDCVVDEHCIDDYTARPLTDFNGTDLVLIGMNILAPLSAIFAELFRDIREKT